MIRYLLALILSDLVALMLVGAIILLGAALPRHSFISRNIHPTSTRSRWLSVNSRCICARPPNIQSRASCVGSVALLTSSARASAKTSFVMPDMLEHDRNLL